MNFFKFIRSVNKHLDKSDKDFFNRLKDAFEFKPSNLELYKVALTHKSASTIVSSQKKVNNERLEYLGDSVLDAIISEILFTSFPNRDEGFLTKMRSRIVSRQSLNAIALSIGLDDLVVTQAKNLSTQKHIFGDALEAFIGAMYLDLGYNKTARWIARCIFDKHIDLRALQSTETDYKSKIIELAQKHKFTIQFNSIECEAKDKLTPHFESKVLLNSKLLGTGYGSSKKEAEQNASMVALERIDIVPIPSQKVEPEALKWQN
ncbi:MAG: ribonuclease III [Bacteroidales bacterium]